MQPVFITRVLLLFFYHIYWQALAWRRSSSYIIPCVVSLSLTSRISKQYHEAQTVSVGSLVNYSLVSTPQNFRSPLHTVRVKERQCLK